MRGMALAVLVGLAGWATVRCEVQAAPSGGVRSVLSSSAQFVVVGTPGGGSEFGSRRTRSLGAVDPRTNAVIWLDPDRLSVTCERVKAAFLRELNLVDLWRHRIQVNILRYGEAVQPIQVTSTRYTDGWRYQVDVPEEVDAEKLVRALAQVLLLELANRSAGARSAEIPLWLGEGFARYLLSTYRLELILQAQSYTIASMVRPDPLAGARELLRAVPALTFEQMSMPERSFLEPNRLPHYQACTQVLVHHLLRLKRGNERLIEFLALLPQVLNWQTALLRSHRGEFRALLDVEKWWALVVLQHTGKNPSQLWSPAELPGRFGELLIVPVRIAARPAELPRKVDYTVQQVITDFEYGQQRMMLNARIAQLARARVHLPPDWDRLAAEYQQLLQSYLHRRDRAGFAPARRGQPVPTPKLLAEEAVGQLNALDRRRGELGGNKREAPEGAQSAGAPSSETGERPR